MKDRTGLVAEIETNTALSAFLGTVALFFTGILISQFKVFNPTIKMPILYLIICTFSFIFSASIYANAAGELARHDERHVNHYMIIANIISEFLGTYLFALAIPLVINAITTDPFLRQAVLVVAIGSLVLYSQSAFSILHRHVPAAAKIAITVTYGALGILVAISQLGRIGSFTIYASALLVFSLILTAGFILNTPELSRS
jgi:hypothetical protein